QLARRGVVDRLRRRTQRDAQRLEMRTQREVIELLTRKAVQTEYDDELYVPLVFAAVRQELLQLRAVRGLRALPWFFEPRDHLIAAAQYSSHALSCVERLRFSTCRGSETRT